MGRQCCWVGVCAALLGCAQEDFGSQPTAEEAHDVDRAIEAAGEDVAADDVPEADPHRKIIYEAGISLVVQDFAQTERQLPRLVKEHGGYLADMSIRRTQGKSRTGQWVARIPVEGFEAFLEALDSLGVPESRNLKADDVSEEFVDLEARITNQQKLEERIVKLLEGRSGHIEDIIKVERELARVRKDVERMQGRKRFLQDRTSYTTVTITAREEREFIPAQVPALPVRIKQAWTGSLLKLQQLGEMLLITVVAATPWLITVLPFAGLLLWVYRRAGSRLGSAS